MRVDGAAPPRRSPAAEAASFGRGVRGRVTAPAPMVFMLGGAAHLPWDGIEHADSHLHRPRSALSGASLLLRYRAATGGEARVVDGRPGYEEPTAPRVVPSWFFTSQRQLLVDPPPPSARTITPGSPGELVISELQRKLQPHARVFRVCVAL